MVEGGGDGADDVEAQPLPQRDCSRIRAEHQVELHGAKVAFRGVFQRMQAHGVATPRPAASVAVT